MEKLSAAQQQGVKKMSDERLRLKLVAAGYEENVVVAMQRETMLSTYAEVLASGGVRPEAPAQVGYNPDVEAQKLAFEKQRWEAEREDKLRREEAKRAQLRREEAEREERRVEREEKLRKEEAKLRREEVEREEKRLREKINCVEKKQNNVDGMLNSVDGKLIEKRDRGRSWLREDRRKCNNKLSYLHRDSVSLNARRPEIEPRRQDVIVPF